MNAIELAVFSSRMAALCDEMGAVLRQSAFSPNIRDRLDFSCALFDARGELCAQAAHIPVHLGSMAFAMRDIVDARTWVPDSMVVVNDPFLGGTHLPDVTVIAPVFHEGRRVGFVVNRAHHACIGGDEPGAMPIASRLEEEGVVMPPTLLVENGVVHQAVAAQLVGAPLTAVADADPRFGDIAAQISANRVGVARLSRAVAERGIEAFESALLALNAYGRRLALQALEAIPTGTYRACDWLEDDGLGQRDIPIAVTVTIADGRAHVDFDGTAGQTRGNVNCPLSVAAAAVFYVFRCLMPAQTPACAGTFSVLSLSAPLGSLVNAQRPAAVAAGNVETSSRIVDALLQALSQALPDRIPAASQGTMNNLAMGAHAGPQGPRWDYYETLGGGMGGHPGGPGLSAVQTHMTNTLNTPVETLERHFPVQIARYAVRRGSGGRGRHAGGDGVVRAWRFLAPACVTLLTERRARAPWGLAGGQPGAAGENRLNGECVPAKTRLSVQAGDVLEVLTPGGGGWGEEFSENVSP